ncbi:ROK family protein [Microbacterium sp. NPDC057944]|uniref:ROK family transcriptional regulator n=1 Tax=Microbacterium sp. NPDC057944 TaxID=3346286 RepID=UPI0036D88FB6
MTDRASGVEGVRRANLGEVLRLVHHDGPRSRAVITADTGLNRSTVADLVAELVSHGLVVEQEPDSTRRVGRPSPIVAPSEQVVAIAVNPEVDAIEIGVIALGGSVRERVRVECVEPPSVEDVTAGVEGFVRRWRESSGPAARIVGIGLAVPGLVRAEDGIVRLAPHLEWRDAPIGDALATALGLPVFVGNDASLGASAERLFGAARAHEDVVYLNGGSSGIGGGLILDGRLIGGAGGYAGEWGQTRPGILSDDDRRTDGGVLEDEVNRSRLLQAAQLGPVDDTALAAVLSATSDPQVISEIDRQRRVLTAALANAVNVLNPSIVVLGGFLAMLRARDALSFDAEVRARSLQAPAEQMEVTAAGLGADRLLIGAAEAAFAPLLADPLRF